MEENGDLAVENTPAEPEFAAEELALVSDAVDALVTLFAKMTVETNAAMCASEAGATAGAFAALPANWKLQIVSPVIFCDGELAVVSPENLLALRQTVAVLDAAGVGVMEASALVDGDTWLALAEGLVAVAKGDRSRLAALVGGTVRFGRHPAARAGADPKQFDSEVYAARKVGQLVKAVDVLVAPGDPWNWQVAVSALRGVESAHQAVAAACLRAIEIDAEAWSGSWGAASIALHMSRTLQLLKLRDVTRRAAVHAAFALGAHGLLDGVGRTLKDAANAALSDLTGEFASAAARPVTEHQARTIALVSVLTPDTVVMSALPGVLPLVRVLYEMERFRLEQDAGRRPSFTDALAYVAAASDQRFDQKWLAALARAAGGLAVGTTVRMPDGTVGIAADPGRSGHLMRPIVMHGAGFATPDANVTPVCS